MDLLPFLGIFLFLLLLFIYGPRPHNRDAPVDLPKARSATSQSGALREDAIHIAVTRDGRFFFGGQQTALGDLPSLIQAAVRGGSERKIYLHVDSKAKNKQVEVVVDRIRLTGIANVAILAEKLAPL